VRFLDAHRLMTLATNRPDGWPQATTVAYVNDGLTLYCFVSRLSQKYLNIRRDPRVSVAIAGEFQSPEGIFGLSLAATAVPVEDGVEYDRIAQSFVARFPEYGSWPAPHPTMAPALRLRPELVSLVDYRKGFGHSDLFTLSAEDLARHKKSLRSDWLAPL
jgi:general stress protein 26